MKTDTDVQMLEAEADRLALLVVAGSPGAVEELAELRAKLATHKRAQEQDADTARRADRERQRRAQADEAERARAQREALQAKLDAALAERPALAEQVDAALDRLVVAVEGVMDNGKTLYEAATDLNGRASARLLMGDVVAAAVTWRLCGLLPIDRPARPYRQRLAAIIGGSAEPEADR